MSRVIQQGNIRETYLDRFDGGLVNDPRDPRGNVCRMVSNYDVITNPRKMTPYHQTEDGNTSQSADTIRNFAVALRTGTTYSIYGLGRISAVSNLAKIYYKDLTSGAAKDLDDNDWSAAASGESATGSATNFNLFTYYRKTGMIYGARDGSNIWNFSPTGAGFTDSSVAVTYTDIGQGLVHSKDDILYIPYYNNGGGAGLKSAVAKYDGTTWTTTSGIVAALLLPDYLAPVSICEMGSLIATGCTPASAEGNSIVYFWNRDSTLTTVSESVDWGPDVLRILEYIDGELIGISQQGGASAPGGVNPRTASSLQDRIIFRRLEGNRAVKFLEIVRDGDVTNVGSTRIPIAKQKVNNRLFFMMLVEFGGVVRDGLWSIGKNSFGEWTLIHEQTTNNDTALVVGDTLENFYVLDDFRFMVSQNAAGTWSMTKTAEGPTAFSHYSVYETVRYNGGDSSLVKDLTGATVTHEPLPANASVEVAYRTDEDTAWTLILTSDTDNAISKSAVNIESSGAALPKDYREIQFRLRSTGGASGEGAEITGFSFKETIKKRDNYDPI